MVGNVYHLSKESAVGAHPCVVVIEIKGTKECLVIPAFTPGRDTIENFFTNLESSGIKREDVGVKLDNKQIINYTKKYDGHKAYWVAAQSIRIDRNSLTFDSKIGVMKPQALHKIISCLIRWMDKNPDQFSKPLEKKIKKLQQSLLDT